MGSIHGIGATKGKAKKANEGQFKLHFVTPFQTYNTDMQTGDSAATATAIFSGTKTTHRTLGYDDKIVAKRPSSEEKAEKVDNILDMAQEAGMKTGLS